jgi:DNA repair exonuclease SbcCD ATPase subunit
MEAVRELRELARRRPLRGEELARAKELMKFLREHDFTNEEISELTGYSASTVKLYTRGVVVKDPKPKEELQELLSQMVEAGLDLEGIRAALSMKAALEKRGVSLEDVSSLLGEVKRSGVGIRELLKFYEELRGLGLSIAQLAEALSYKEKLGDVGLTFEGLKDLYEASKSFGGYEGLLKVAKEYGSLQSIEAELENARGERESLEEEVERLRREREALERQVEDVKREVEELAKERSRIEVALELYERLRAKGFDEEVLRRLEELSRRFGGVKEVLEAVGEYRSLEEIKEERSKVDADLKRVQAEHEHVMTTIGVLEELLYKHKFSSSAIIHVYRVAKKYGGPVEVLEALEKFGELKGIEEDLERRRAELREVEARVRELNKQVGELRALREELGKEVEGLLKSLVEEGRRALSSLEEASSRALNSVSSKASEAVELLKGKSSELLKSLANGYEEYSKKLGELKAEAGRLEEELRLARIVRLLIERPSECKNLPLELAPVMLQATLNFLEVKGVNPRIDAYSGVRTADYIKWAIEAVGRAIRKRESLEEEA